MEKLQFWKNFVWVDIFSLVSLIKRTIVLNLGSELM